MEFEKNIMLFAQFDPGLLLSRWARRHGHISRNKDGSTVADSSLHQSFGATGRCDLARDEKLEGDSIWLVFTVRAERIGRSATAEKG